jgi:hypothetical protein
MRRIAASSAATTATSTLGLPNRRPDMMCEDFIGTAADLVHHDEISPAALAAWRALPGPGWLDWQRAGAGAALLRW